MPARVFYTQENIKEIWIRRDDLLRYPSVASKTATIEGKRVNLETFTALGNEPPSDENLLSLIKTVSSKPKHVLPNDKQEECKKVCIVHWLGKWGQKESADCVTYTSFRAKAIQEAKEKFLFDINSLVRSLTMQWWRHLRTNARIIFKKEDEEYEQRILISYGIEDPTKYTLPAALPPAIVRLNDLEPRVEDLESHVGEMRPLVEDLKTRVEAVENIKPRVEGLESHVGEMRPLVEDLKSRVEEVKNIKPRVEGLETRVEEVENIKPRVEEVENIKPRVDDLENQMSLFAEEFRALQTRVNQTNGSPLGQDANTLRNTMHSMQYTVCNMFHTLQTRANQTDDSLGNLRQELEGQLDVLLDQLNGLSPRKRQLGFRSQSMAASIDAAGRVSGSTSQPTNVMGLHRQFRGGNLKKSSERPTSPQQATRPQPQQPGTPRYAHFTRPQQATRPQPQQPGTPRYAHSTRPQQATRPQPQQPGTPRYAHSTRPQQATRPQQQQPGTPSYAHSTDPQQAMQP